MAAANRKRGRQDKRTKPPLPQPRDLPADPSGKSSTPAETDSVKSGKRTSEFSPIKKGEQAQKNEEERCDKVQVFIRPNPKLRREIDALIGQLDGEPNSIGTRLTDALVAMRQWQRSKSSAESLLKLTKDSNVRLKKLAVSAVVRLVSRGNLGMPACFADTLLSLAADPDPEVRRCCVGVLGYYGDAAPERRRKAFNLAIQALRDVSTATKLAALNSLYSFGIDLVSSKLPDLVERLQDHSSAVREAACRLIGWLGDDGHATVPKLLKLAIDDNEEGVRKAAISALLSIDPEAKMTDFGPDEAKPYTRFVQALQDFGADARDYRRRLQRKWQGDTEASYGKVLGDTPPPCLKDKWHDFTDKERKLLTELWRRRRSEGIDIKEFLQKSTSISGSKDSEKLLRTHLSKIRKKIEQSKLKVPFQRRSGLFIWDPWASGG